MGLLSRKSSKKGCFLKLQSMEIDGWHPGRFGYLDGVTWPFVLLLLVTPFGLLSGFTNHKQSPIESLIPPTPASPGSPGPVTLQAKSYLSNDPALVVLYKQLREKTLQTLKGASQVPAQAEWSFILRNARLYDRMGCDLLALDLVRHWEFLGGPPSMKSVQDITPDLQENEVNYRKMLRRRSSLVVADMPAKPGVSQDPTGPTVVQKPQPPPSTFHEPDANSLLDTFGF